MRKVVISLTFIIAIMLVATGCNNEGYKEEGNIEDVSLEGIAEIPITQESSNGKGNLRGKYLDNIEFGIGDSTGELIEKWGPPLEVDYIHDGLYLKYENVVFYTDSYLNDDKTYSDGTIGTIEANEGYGVKSGMTIEESREILGEPDGMDIFDELKEYGEGIIHPSDYYYRDQYTIRIPYDKDTKKIHHISLGTFRRTPDIIGKGFIELTDWEMSIYEDYRLDFDENKLNGLNPINVMKMWIHALQENDYETQWELFTKEEKQLGWDKEQHIEQSRVKEDFSEFENPINIEVNYDDDYKYASISWEDKYLEEHDGTGNLFRFSFLLVKGRDRIWKVAFRPMQ